MGQGLTKDQPTVYMTTIIIRLGSKVLLKRPKTDNVTNVDHCSLLPLSVELEEGKRTMHEAGPVLAAAFPNKGTTDTE